MSVGEDGVFTFEGLVDGLKIASAMVVGIKVGDRAVPDPGPTCHMSNDTKDVEPVEAGGKCACVKIPIHMACEARFDDGLDTVGAVHDGYAVMTMAIAIDDGLGNSMVMMLVTVEASGGDPANIHMIESDHLVCVGACSLKMSRGCVTEVG